jgi:hypothetical protein
VFGACTTTQPDQGPAPVADAGPDRTVAVSTPVYLNASGSTGVSYLVAHWTIVSAPAGSTAKIEPVQPSTSWSVPTGFLVSLRPDVPGTYKAQLVIQEDPSKNPGFEHRSSPPATITITAVPCAPVIDDSAYQAKIVDFVGSIEVSTTLSTPVTEPCRPNATFTYQWSVYLTAYDRDDPPTLSPQDANGTVSTPSPTLNIGVTDQTLVHLVVTDDLGQHADAVLEVDESRPGGT